MPMAAAAALGSEPIPKASRASQGELVGAAMFRAPHGLVDIGANLCDRSFEQDRLEVISRARDMNVRAMVVTGERCAWMHTLARACAGKHRLTVVRQDRFAL